MGPTVLICGSKMARILTMVWQLCFASCNREKQMLQPCYGDKRSQCGTAFFFVNAVSLHPMWKENISQEQKCSWWTEAVTSQEFSSLPSHGPHNWKRGRLVGRAQWIIFSCSKNCVSSKISVGFLMPTDRHVMWLSAEQVLSVAGLFLFLQCSVSIPGSWNKSTEVIKKVQLLLIKHLRC